MKINHFHSNFSYLNLMCKLENSFYLILFLIIYSIQILPIIYHYIKGMKKLEHKVYLSIIDLFFKHLEIKE